MEDRAIVDLRAIAYGKILYLIEFYRQKFRVHQVSVETMDW